MVSFYGKQIQDQKKGAVYLPAIRKVRLKEIITKEEAFYWGAPDYKLYPSSLKSWRTCPKEFITKNEKYSGIKQIQGINRTRRGSAIHAELQKDFLLSDKICPKPQNITDQRILDKLEKGWPEIPFHDFETGFSGSADSAMLWRGKIVPVEIKTTSMDKKDWKESVSGSFRQKEAWTIQLCNYIYHFKKLRYWEQDISEGLLVIVNSSYDPGEEGGEGECEQLVDYSQYEDRISTLIEHVAKHRLAYMKGDDMPCTYPLCNSHS